MFIAHLPAAYLLGKVIKRRSKSARSNSDTVMSAVLFGGIAPDIDLIYFYTIGGKQVVHHEYWTHVPFFWLLMFMVCTTVTYFVGCARYVYLLSLAFAGVFLHLILDTATGKIQWLYPYSTQSLTFVEVPSVHHWWVLNFLFHWTFLVEILLVAIAVAVGVSCHKAQTTIANA